MHVENVYIGRMFMAMKFGLILLVVLLFSYIAIGKALGQYIGDPEIEQARYERCVQNARSINVGSTHAELWRLMRTDYRYYGNIYGADDKQWDRSKVVLYCIEPPPDGWLLTSTRGNRFEFAIDSDGSIVEVKRHRIERRRIVVDSTSEPEPYEQP